MSREGFSRAAVARLPASRDVFVCSYLEPAVGAAFGGATHTGCTNAPLPAESQTANRTHALPVASNGIAKCLVPNGAESVAEITWRSTFLPSLQTTSTKFNGKVQS